MIASAPRQPNETTHRNKISVSYRRWGPFSYSLWKKSLKGMVEDTELRSQSSVVEFVRFGELRYGPIANNRSTFLDQPLNRSIHGESIACPKWSTDGRALLARGTAGGFALGRSGRFSNREIR